MIKDGGDDHRSIRGVFKADITKTLDRTFMNLFAFVLHALTETV